MYSSKDNVRFHSTLLAMQRRPPPRRCPFPLISRAEEDPYEDPLLDTLFLERIM